MSNMPNMIDGILTDAAGTQDFDIPSGYAYITVDNNTDWAFDLFAGTLKTDDITNAFASTPLYSRICHVIPDNARRIRIKWADGSVTRTVRVIISEKPQESVIYAPPGGIAEVKLTGDTVGMAKEATLGLVKAAVLNLGTEATLGAIETALGLLGTEATLSSIHTTLGSLGTEATLAAILAALGHTITDTGSVTDVSDRSGREAGKVRLEDSDGVLIAPVQGHKETAAGAGENVVKLGAGRVYAIVADVACTVNDGTGNDVFLIPANTPVNFGGRPLRCLTDIRIGFTGAGAAYLQYD